MSTAAPDRPDYYRRDLRDGINPPDLSKDCTYAEHIVRARGKRTKYTSVSLDLSRIRDFGEASYRLDQTTLADDRHGFVEHQTLVDHLRVTAQKGDKAERLKAVQALRYARRRKEGLVDWRFDIAAVPRKDLITWGAARIQKYFARVT